jgi:hypothetical protein
VHLGKRADLVLLDADALPHIRNISRSRGSCEADVPCQAGRLSFSPEGNRSRLIGVTTPLRPWLGLSHRTNAGRQAVGQQSSFIGVHSITGLSETDIHAPQKYRFAGYNHTVRIKTSVTLPEDLLGRLDRIDKNRSAVLERAARAYLAEIERRERDRRDIEIINRNSKRLNREAMDALKFQRLP